MKFIWLLLFLSHNISIFTSDWTEERWWGDIKLFCVTIWRMSTVTQSEVAVKESRCGQRWWRCGDIIFSLLCICELSDFFWYLQRDSLVKLWSDCWWQSAAVSLHPWETRWEYDDLFKVKLTRIVSSNICLFYGFLVSVLLHNSFVLNSLLNCVIIICSGEDTKTTTIQQPRPPPTTTKSKSRLTEKGEINVTTSAVPAPKTLQGSDSKSFSVSS